MDQITALFEGINWDNVMNVIADYVTKIDVGAGLTKIFNFFMSFVGVIVGGAI